MRELVVLSHLGWDFVWQRPQHLISRLATDFDRVWFVEEPRIVGLDHRPRLVTCQREMVTRAWMEVPGEERHCGFGDVADELCGRELLQRLSPMSERTVWLYTPMALPVAQRMEPTVLAYDVMDDLASFAGAPPALPAQHRRALRAADLVFTGGRSLQRSVARYRPDAHCFPSGVEPAHYAAARALRTEHRPRVAGYVGVIDERLDLALIADLAHELQDWEIHMVGPVRKIEERLLPRAANLRYRGARDYRALPEVMAGFDVALMPFALNEATRHISPTKTLEYLAAGLPVVSTRIPDVVSDFAAVVDLADDAAGFGTACRRAVIDGSRDRERKVRALLHRSDWDTIARSMARLLGPMDRRNRSVSTNASAVTQGASA